MCARAVAWLAAVLAVAVKAQDSHIYVDVRPDHSELNNLPEEIERRKLSELAKELEAVKGDIMLLYTEYTAKAGQDLKGFLKNVSTYAEEAVTAMEQPDTIDHGDCRGLFEIRLRKIKLDAHRAASFSGENHHKFLLGHMIVFRMHINRSDEYIKKCDRALHNCGVVCDEKPKIKRWKRLAAGEIHRIRDDIQHTRRAYKDLVAHAKRRLVHLKKQLMTDASEAALMYQECLANETQG